MQRMKDRLSIIEVDIENLRKAKTQNNSEQEDRSVESLTKHLLDNEGYRQLGDERVLGTALRLLDQELGKELKDHIIPVMGWLELIRDVNDKFYAILNHEVALDELLFAYLPK